MVNRRKTRRLVFQAIYEADFRGMWNEDYVSQAFSYLTEEDNHNDIDYPYSSFLIHGLAEKKDDLDKIIAKSTHNWPIDKILVIDKNILRLGLFELLFGKSFDVPERVAINESIELAKSFGNESNGKFINGVIGFVYKELDEPGKNDNAPTRTKSVVRVVGALTYAIKERKIYFLLINDIFGKWTLPKGTLKANEDEKVGVRRVLKGDTGITVIPEDQIGNNSYMTRDENDVRTKKQAVYYLANAEYTEPVFEKNENGIRDIKWFSQKDLDSLELYKDMKIIINENVNKVVENISR